MTATDAIHAMTPNWAFMAATTGPRKAELAFYGAVLGLDPAAATPEGKRKLLEDVIKARAVLDAEFDLARKYLSLP